MKISDYIPIWKDLKKDEQERLEKNVVSHTVPAHTPIRNQDDGCAGLIFVQSGQLRAYIMSDEGKEITLFRLLPGDICLLSASCMMHSIQFDIFVVSEKESEFGLINADVYKSIMKASAPLANYTNEMISNRFTEVMWLMEQILWKSFDQRLAEFLVEESTIENASCLHITHDAIGNHLGHPREVVSRMLHYFQNEGYISLSRGKIELVDIDGLRKLYE